MAIQTETIVTAGDFSYPDHDPDWLVIGGTADRTVRVCRVCGKPDVTPSETDKNIGNFQDPFPRFGADEYLSW